MARVKTMPALASNKRVIVEFPVRLLKRTDQAASQLSTNRSQLIRSAVERFLDALSKEKMEQELAAGYQANAVLDRRISAEFAHVDAENL